MSSVPPRKARRFNLPPPPKMPVETSDTDESVRSAASVESTGSKSDLTIVAEFDEYARYLRPLVNRDTEDHFLGLIKQVKAVCLQWDIAINECKRLQGELDKKGQECSDLEDRVATARKVVDQERKSVRKLVQQRDSLKAKIVKASEVLYVNREKLPDDTCQQLAFLNSTRVGNNGFDGKYAHAGATDLSAIYEGHTTGSLLSDFSCSQSEDGLDATMGCSNLNMRRAHVETDGDGGEPVLKKRRSSVGGDGVSRYHIAASDQVRATTTLTVSKDGGPITATSIIESIPPPATEPDNRSRPLTTKLDANNRPHKLQLKTVMMPESCNACGKRIAFSKTAYKCKECRAICHMECGGKLPVPCVPCGNTPNQRGSNCNLADYAPPISPMIPALVIHCIKEIESRGLTELGLYRIPGSERDVKLLKERFLSGKGGVPILSAVDVHVLCGTVKDFLRLLKEPLLTQFRWKEFVRAVDAKQEDVAPALYQLVSELPQPNRDTLAYLMLHLRRIAISPECKMPVGNLAKVFGPTIVGYSSPDLDSASLLMETTLQSKVVKHLIDLPDDFWSSYTTNVAGFKTPNSKLHQVPSTDSLLGSVSGKNSIFTPPFYSRLAKKKKTRFFQSPY